VKRWDWTWEEPRSSTHPRTDPVAKRTDPVAKTPTVDSETEISTGPHAGPGEIVTRFRRRRAGAGLALLAILVLLFAAIGSSGGRHSNRSKLASRTDASHPGVPRLTPAEEHALVHQAEEKAINSVLSYTPVVVRGGYKGNEVALTFDDGPGPYTQRLVSALEALHVPATFFVVGAEERYFSAGTLQELRSGYIIGDHTETHPMMATLSAHDQREQLLEQVYRLELLGAPVPRLFRPPYGSFNATTLKELRAQHMLMILWSTDTGDFAKPGTEVIVRRALEGAHPGAIILLHDAGGDRSETIAAIPAIVRGLRARGLRPVTVPRLMLDDPPPREQKIPTGLAGG
jgi:peptidoglycan/xylan/chitin deacetylase (PgdA/CDA1 family)